MNIVEVKNISFSYNEANPVLKDISFAIEEGTYTTIIGHNGSGKSTLAKLMAGLLNLNVGEIYINGLKIEEANLKEIRKSLGIVFQNPDNQFIGSTVKDDIAFGLENRLIDPLKMNGIIEEYASKVGLSDFLEKEPQNLSGGQKQRVAIAGVMAMKPKIIIFDEATSMLDPKGKKEIKELMYRLHSEDKLTVISITHDIEEVLKADDCIVLNKGQIFMHDKPEQVFEHANELRKIDLDIPFIERIRELFKDKHLKIKGNDLDSIVEELCQYRSNH